MLYIMMFGYKTLENRSNLMSNLNHMLYLIFSVSNNINFSLFNVKIMIFVCV